MTVPEHDASDPQFDRMTARLLRREALRRAAQELNTTSGPGLEDALARISAEVTEEALSRQVISADPTVPGGANRAPGPGQSEQD
jgi:phage shock protein A